MKSLLTYFKFSKTEYNGFFIVLLIIILYIIVRILISSRLSADAITDEMIVFDQDSLDSGARIVSMSKSDVKEELSPKQNTLSSYENAQKSSRVAKLFPFDPNNLPVEDWRKLGFTDKQIAVIKNYEKKGGQFKNKTDLKKIYSINDRLYQRIEPYITIKRVRETSYMEGTQMKNVRKDLSVVDDLININTCDTVALMRLNGIGSILSNRILKYKDLLGGFHCVEQLKEVYGITPETYERIKAYIAVGNQAEIKKININRIDANSLAKHPYLSRKSAKLIVNYRDQHGNYIAMEDLIKVGTLSDITIAKIAPYLIFENDSR